MAIAAPVIDWSNPGIQPQSQALLLSVANHFPTTHVHQTAIVPSILEEDEAGTSGGDAGTFGSAIMG